MYTLHVERHNNKWAIFRRNNGINKEYFHLAGINRWLMVPKWDDCHRSAWLNTPGRTLRRLKCMLEEDFPDAKVFIDQTDITDFTKMV